MQGSEFSNSTWALENAKKYSTSVGQSFPEIARQSLLRYMYRKYFLY
jgi:hypothetical protein